MTHTANVGLRERKKHRTTLALQDAAYRLFGDTIIHVP